jgi:molybdate transport repressor ModE-like protein
VDIDARTLRTFCEVIRAGSFTKAARKLGYSQSSVTAQIRSLEREVGEPVFTRLPGGVALTSAGITLRTYAEQLLRIVTDLEEGLRSQAHATPRIRLGLAPALAYGEQLSRLAKLGLHLIPGVRLDLQIMGSAAAHAALYEGRLEGVLQLSGPATRSAADHRAPAYPAARRSTAVGRTDPHALIATPIHTMEFAALMALPQHRRSSGQQGQPGHLRNRSVVVADNDCPSQRWLPEYLRLRDGWAPESLGLGSMDGVYASVQAGLGCAMLPVDPSAAWSGHTLLPVPDVPNMHWAVTLLCAPNRDLREVHRRGLAEAVRLAYSPAPWTGSGAPVLEGMPA